MRWPTQAFSSARSLAVTSGCPAPIFRQSSVLSRAQPGGVELRKLAAIQAVQVNGNPVTTTVLKEGDLIALAAVELLVSVRLAESAAPVKSSSVVVPDRDLLRHKQELDAKAELLARQQRDLEKARQELGQLREQIHVRYQERSESSRRAGEEGPASAPQAPRARAERRGGPAAARPSSPRSGKCCNGNGRSWSKRRACWRRASERWSAS